MAAVRGVAEAEDADLGDLGDLEADAAAAAGELPRRLQLLEAALRGVYGRCRGACFRPIWRDPLALAV